MAVPLLNGALDGDASAPRDIGHNVRRSSRCTGVYTMTEVCSTGDDGLLKDEKALECLAEQ